MAFLIVASTIDVAFRRCILPSLIDASLPATAANIFGLGFFVVALPTAAAFRFKDSSRFIFAEGKLLAMLILRNALFVVP